MAVQIQPSQLVQQKFERLSFQYDTQVSVESNMSYPSTPSTPTSPIDVELRMASEADRELILQFLRTFFFKDEPLNSYLELITDEKPICNDIEKFSVKDLSQGYTILAFYGGKLIGVCINGVLERNYLEQEDDFVVADEKFSKIYEMLDFVARDSYPFRKFPGCDKAMTIKIISVDGSYRGKGIAKILMNKTREVAKEAGCGFMTVDCTSHFTALALKRLGFELHYTKDYADYKVDGKVVFEPAPPHKAVTVYTQKL